MSRHRTHRTDLNQPDIVDALRKIGADVEVIDDNGSIRCKDKCGFEIILEPVAIVLTEDQIEWVGKSLEVVIYFASSNK